MRLFQQNNGKWQIVRLAQSDNADITICTIFCGWRHSLACISWPTTHAHSLVHHGGVVPALKATSNRLTRDTVNLRYGLSWVTCQSDRWRHSLRKSNRGTAAALTGLLRWFKPALAVNSIVYAFNYVYFVFLVCLYNIYIMCMNSVTYLTC